jgi:CheY-like chemotaxis protein
MVLIVDDDESIGEALQLMLQLRGYESTIPSNGAEALAWLRTNDRPCLIFLDLMMPVMDGLQFLDCSRSEGFRGVPTVVITAFRDDRSVIEGCPVLRKPVEFEDVMSLVARHCQATV